MDGVSVGRRGRVGEDEEEGGKMLLCLGWEVFEYYFCVKEGKVEGISQVQVQRL